MSQSNTEQSVSIPCGTEYAYVAGCRCPHCQAASAAARARRRAAEDPDELRRKWRDAKRPREGQTLMSQSNTEQSDSRGPGRCDQVTVSGDRCSRRGTVEAWITYPRQGRAGWERFCTQHANRYGVWAHRRTRELVYMGGTRS